MINSIDTPKLIYPVTVLEIVPEMPNMDGTDPIQDENSPKKRKNINGKVKKNN